IPVSFLNSGTIVFLNGSSAPSSNAPITTLPVPLSESLEVVDALLLSLPPQAAMIGAPPRALLSAIPPLTISRRGSGRSCRSRNCSMSVIPISSPRARSRRSDGLDLRSCLAAAHSLHGCSAVLGEEARRVRVHQNSHRRSDLRAETALGAHAHAHAAHQHVDDRLVAHWLHHVDFARQRVGAPGLHEAQVLRPDAELSDARLRAGGQAPLV